MSRAGALRRHAACALLPVIALLSVVAGAAPAATPIYRSVCDPIRFHEHITPIIAERPAQCGWWGHDGDGPLADVVGIKKIRWKSWGRTATGRGLIIPTHVGDASVPVTVTLSRPYTCLHAGRTLHIYSRERIRTSFGTHSWTMRVPRTGYCA
jgi:hypothetical protein